MRTSKVFSAVNTTMHKRMASVLGWVEEDALPITTVDARTVVATSRVLDRATLAVLSPKTVAKGDVPLLLAYQGQLFVVDGHHRLATALLAKQYPVRVRIAQPKTRS